MLCSLSADGSANHIIKHVKVQLPNQVLAIFCPCGSLLHIFLGSLSEGFSRYLQLFNYPLVLRVERPSILFVVFSDLSLLTLLSVVLEGVLQLVTSLLGVLGDAQLQIHQLLEFRILSWIHTTLSTQY